MIKCVFFSCNLVNLTSLFTHYLLMFCKYVINTYSDVRGLKDQGFLRTGPWFVRSLKDNF